MALKNFILFLFLFVTITGCSQKDQTDNRRIIPHVKGYVNDFVELFEKDDSLSLDSLVKAIQKQTSIQLAIATVDSFMIGNRPIEDYALDMLRTWGVGEKKKNNGILILIAPAMRRMRVENGYGIEKYLTNEETKEIVDTVFIPHFKEGKFFDGTKYGILALIQKLQQKGYH